MTVLKLGSTVDQVNLETIKNVLALSQGRVKVDVSQTDLIGIFKRSKHAALLDHSGKPSDLHEADKKFLFELVYLRVYTLIKFLLEKNENLLHIKRIVDGDEEINLGEHALITKDHKLLELLLNLESPIFK